MTTQSNPGFVTGQQPSAAEWNSYFGVKLDASNAGTMAGQNANAVAVTGGTISGADVSISTVLATGSTASRSLAARFADIVNVLDFGAIPSTSIDSSANIQAAINYAAAVAVCKVFVPAGQFRCANGITIPNGVELVGAGVTPAWGATTGTILLFDAGVAVGVTMGAASNNDTCAIRKLAIGRAGGAPAASTVGVKLLDALQCVLEDVFSVNHGVGFYLRADAPFGLGLMADRIWTAAIVDAHVVVDGWPEARLSHFRFGSNGGHDYACNAYVRFTGGSTSNAASGPNTFVMTNGQCNQSGGTVGALFQFSNQLSGSIATVENIKIADCHVETVNYALENDSTWPTLGKITFADNSIDCNTDFFNLAAGTSLWSLTISNNQFEGPLNLTTTGTLTDIEITDNDIAQHGGASSLVVSGADTVTVVDNGFKGNFTVSGTLTGGALKVAGNRFSSGTFTCSLVSAYMDIDQPGWAGVWTPVLQFGGASVGIAYTTQSGTFHIHDGWVEVEFNLEISSQGSSTGVAAIASLPIPSLVTSRANGLGQITQFAGMGSNPQYFAPAAQGSEMIFQEFGNPFTIQMNNSSFTNTSQLIETLRYRVL